MTSLAWFITGHGYGHASRSLAIMDALAEQTDRLSVTVVSNVNPEFLKSHPGHFDLDQFVFNADIGLIQKDAFTEDLEKTRSLIQGHYPFSECSLQPILDFLKIRKVEALVCDIAPMGIEVARRLGVPSILVENFTWPFIYRGYPVLANSCSEQIEYMESLTGQATLRLVTRPFCVKTADAKILAPISRAIRKDLPFPIQNQKLKTDKPVILLTTGGFDREFDIAALLKLKDFQFAMMKNSVPTPVEIMTFDPAKLYFPNLVQDVDAIIGKAGYSTACEAYHAGTPFGFMRRPEFRESDFIERFLNEEDLGIEMSHNVSEWTPDLLDTLVSKKQKSRSNTGAHAAAEWILQLV